MGFVLLIDYSQGGIGWLIDWLTDSLIGWLIDWYIQHKEPLLPDPPGYYHTPGKYLPNLPKPTPAKYPSPPPYLQSIRLISIYRSNLPKPTPALEDLARS